MKIAIVASEVAPFSKTGGLGDVTGALPAALAAEGAETVTVSPLYRSVRAHAPGATRLRIRVPVGSAVIEAPVHRMGTFYFLEHDPYFDRDALYGTPLGDYSDNVSRFIFLCRGALELLRLLGAPDVLQLNDWQTGLVPIYVKTLYARSFTKTKTVFTVHNLAYQGLFWHLDMPLTGLDWKHYTWRELEFHDRLSFMKAGLVHADALTTVSPTYAREILTPELGCGLEGVLRERAGSLHGILNGIDMEEWNPETDPHLAANYSARSLQGKAQCKAALQFRFGLPARPDVPLVGWVGRLAEQKGMDLFLAAVDALRGEDVQFAVLGSGDKRLQDAVLAARGRNPERMAVHVAFDASLAHQMEAGCDVLAVPSRYEPCGLNQMYSLRYGTVPVVRATGGLADTVEDGVTGFTFGPPTPEGLVEALRRAIRALRDRKTWLRMMTEGMKRDFSWARSARRYLELFRSLHSGKVEPKRPPKRRGSETG